MELSYVQGKRSFEDVVKSHIVKLKRRNGQPMAHEHMPPTGQANYWYLEVLQQVPDCGKKVAHQIARLCGDDSKVTTTYRSLADAVGQYDKTGTTAYVQRGIRMLEDAGWLSVETIGEKRGARTTFYLELGDDTKYKKKWDDGFYDGSDYHNHYVV